MKIDLSSRKARWLGVSAITSTVALAMAFAASVLPVSAQRFVDSPTAAPTAAPTPLTASPAKVQPARLGGPDTVLRHLPNTVQGFRISGEIGATEWPLYLSDSQARSRLKFRVGYLSAVSVMPEASKLTVSINDVAIGTTPVMAANSVRTIEFDVPSDLVKPGFNAVRIAVDQRHRVECSLQSSFELWTQIDPSQTGLIVPAAVAAPGDASELAALPPDGRGALPVRAVMTGQLASADVERLIMAVQMIAATGHFEQPFVDIGPPASGQYGVNLVIGRYSEIKDIPGVSRIGLVAGPRVGIAPATDQLRTTIVITGESDEDVNQAIAQFGVGASLRGAEAGLRAARAFPGYRINPGETVRLVDLGIPSQEFTGHYFHTAFNIILPADFYSADYAKVPLDLAGGYGAGLLSSAQVIVAINGRNAVTAPLPRSSGDVFKDMVLPLPLGDLRPGLNRIEIFAQLPMAADANCDPLAVINGAKRFLFLDQTSIQIPNLARIGRVPDLAVTATGGFPFLGGGKRPKLFTPSPDLDSIGAAATIAARMAASAGKPIDFQFTTTAPTIGSGATLMVAPANRLDNSLLEAFEIDPTRLRKAWSDRYATDSTPLVSSLTASDVRRRNRLVLQKNLPAACNLRWRDDGKPDRMSTGSIIEPAAATEVEAPKVRKPDPSPQLFDAWSQELSGQSSLRRWAFGFVNSAADFWREVVGRARQGVDDFSVAPVVEVNPIDNRDNLFLIAQAPLGSGVDSVWTLATAPNSRLLAQSAECLSDPRVWTQVRGQMSMLDDSEGRITSVEPTSMSFVSTQPFSPTNLRLVAASWLSLNKAVYVGLTVLAALLLAISTFRFVRNVGRSDT